MARPANPVISGTVTRTVTYTVADCVMVELATDGKPVTTTATCQLFGDYKGDAERFRAACIASKKFPTVAMALNLRTVTELRAIDMTDFIAHSKVVDKVSDYEENVED